MIWLGASEEEIKVAKTKKYSTELVTKEMQVKITWKITIPSTDQNVEQFLYVAGRRLSWYKIFRKEFGRIC